MMSRFEQDLRNAIAFPIQEVIAEWAKVDEVSLIPNGTLIYRLDDGRVVRVLLVVQEPDHEATTVMDPGSQ